MTTPRKPLPAIGGDALGPKASASSPAALSPRSGGLLPPDVRRFDGISRIDALTGPWDNPEGYSLSFVCPVGSFAVVSSLSWAWLVLILGARTAITLKLNGNRVDLLGELWKGAPEDAGVVNSNSGVLSMSVKLREGDTLTASFYRTDASAALGAQATIGECKNRAGEGTYGHGVPLLSGAFTCLLYPSAGRALETLEVVPLALPEPVGEGIARGVFFRDDLGPDRPEAVQALPLRLDSLGRLISSPPAYEETAILAIAYTAGQVFSLNQLLGGAFFARRLRGLMLYFIGLSPAPVDVRIYDAKIGADSPFPRLPISGVYGCIAYDAFADPFIPASPCGVWIGEEAADTALLKGVKLPANVATDVQLAIGADPGGELRLVLRALL